MRTMASSWRTVMGMEDRALASSSEAWTCLRMATKWDESFSAAASERRGAQRLHGEVSIARAKKGEKGGHTSCSS